MSFSKDHTASPSAPRKPKYGKFPTLLTVADALVYAAEQLENTLANMELLVLMRDITLDPAGLDPETKVRLADMRTAATGIVDKPLQEAAMRGAVELIREMAQESKLVEARAAAHGIRNRGA